MRFCLFHFCALLFFMPWRVVCYFPSYTLYLLEIRYLILLFLLLLLLLMSKLLLLVLFESYILLACWFDLLLIHCHSLHFFLPKTTKSHSFCFDIHKLSHVRVYLQFCRTIFICIVNWLLKLCNGICLSGYWWCFHCLACSFYRTMPVRMWIYTVFFYSFRSNIFIAFSSSFFSLSRYFSFSLFFMSDYWFCTLPPHLNPVPFQK